jgi:hypothetical protein
MSSVREHTRETRLRPLEVTVLSCREVKGVSTMPGTEKFHLFPSTGEIKRRPTLRCGQTPELWPARRFPFLPGCFWPVPSLSTG